MKNYQVLLTSIGSFFVAYTILNGTAQQYVHFAGPENELGCGVIALSTVSYTHLTLPTKRIV